MEAFVASNESQWDVIKRVIDECDYYILIVGGRYGSISADGISYTEKEYRYAKKLGIPVLAFVHADPDKIPVGKAERDEKLQSKLDAFRSEVMAEHPIRKWKSPSELGGLVSRSLIREIKINPRPGWIRNDGSSPVALLERINILTEENRSMREAISAQKKEEPDETLQSGADKVTLRGVRTIRSKGTYARKGEEWSVETTWDDIYRDVGPAIINEATETRLKGLLSRFHSLDEIKPAYDLIEAEVYLETWSDILIQFRALGLMQPGTKKRGVNDKGSYWAITPRGDSHLVSLLAKKKPVLDSL
jgi:hypothetical protein